VKKTGLLNTIVSLLALVVLTGWSSAPALAEQKTVRIAYEEWSSEIASTNLVKAVIRERLGHRCIIKRLSVTAMYEAVTNKTQDAMLAAWLPGQQTYYEKYKGGFVDLGPNLEGGKLGLVVPQVSSTWLLAQDGQHTEPYMKIDSIEELNDHYDDFSGKIIGIESDSGMMTIMREKLIPAYGLEDFELIPGTEVSMTAELANAIKKRKWIVVLGWTPHWMFGRWRLKFLEDPKNIWGAEENIHTLMRKGLKEDMPDVYQFLDNFKWTPEEMEQLLLWNEMGGNPYDNAKRWMRSNPKSVEAWLK
jgi:glycine betaine/proline transport system substrate-binding protein